jgi:hypothetical protein
MHRLTPLPSVLVALALASAGTLGGTCGGSSPPPPLHPEALVVYNENAGYDAGWIAYHYAGQRGIPSKNICAVELPTGQFASKDHLLAARKAIVEDCICKLIPNAQKPVPCNLSNLTAVRLASPITHLALVRGIPPRLYGTGWPSDAEEPSFDFYLAYLIYRTEDIFAPGTGGYTTTTYLTADLVTQANQSMILSAPPLSTAVHLDVAYGRIEAIDRDRTLALVDRTLQAEQLGVTGNFLEERYNTKGWRFIRDVSGSHAPECTSYMTYQPFLFGAPESSWPASICRAGSTWTNAKGPDPNSTADDPVSNIVPGSFMSTVPVAERAGLFLGSAPNPNGHAGFNQFATLLNWRSTASACEPLCANKPTQAERDQCAAASTDYFRELDTSCVGGARGLVGHQVRSYPVQYYGFFPAGWQTAANGDLEKTPPEIRQGGAWQDAVFTDDRYLHFGLHDVANLDDSECTLADGSVVPCPERIAVSLEKGVAFSPPIALGNPRFYLLRLQHRNQASPGGSLRAVVTFQNGSTSVAKEASLPLDAQNLDWTTGELWFQIDPAELAELTGLRLAFASRLSEQVQGFLDLDAVELFDMGTGAQLLDVATGSFAPAAQNATHPGDWATNAIDRLGAVAWWGNSSHHLTAGWGLSVDERFFGAFFMGRTLGESLLLTTGGQSAIIYGDPLYRPVAVRIHIPGQASYGGPPGLTVTSASVPLLGTVLLEAWNGTSRQATVSWSLATCPLTDIAQCGTTGQWTQRLSGVGALSAYPVNWIDFIDPGVEQDVLLRLRVWNPGEEQDELFSYAWFHYRP